MRIARTIRIIRYGLRLRCPECGQGLLFRSLFRMEHRCPFCGLAFTREQGYFVGAIYLNVMATEGILLVIAVLYIMSSRQFDQRLIVILLVLCAALPPLFFHHCRSLWLAIDHIVDPQKPQASSTIEETEDWR